MINPKNLRGIHPFPARMAPAIIWRQIPATKKPLKILDPMCGSGTTLIIARAKGHTAIGFDRDPLAVLLSSTWLSRISESEGLKRLHVVLQRAEQCYKVSSATDEYPKNANLETRAFIDFWFDAENRKQLTALSTVISRVKADDIRQVLWTAFSRMIITKSRGVSLAMDVSHSRPHRVYDKAPVEALAAFPKVFKKLIGSLPFKDEKTDLPEAYSKTGDARALPIENRSIDMIITSPPYLNAIDYIRAHRLALVWMGYPLSVLRGIRSSNIGAEIMGSFDEGNKIAKRAYRKLGNLSRLSSRQQGMVVKFIVDMDKVISEIARVLKSDGKAILVVGNSTISGTYIFNSKAICSLAKDNGLKLRYSKKREIKASRRYLPPPTKHSSGANLKNRMREEIVLSFKKS